MIQTFTKIALAQPDAVRDALVGHLLDHDIALSDCDGVVRASLEHGEARIALVDGSLRIDASAATKSALGQIAAFLASHVREFAPADTQEIQWSGLSGAWLFPDFREMTVLRVRDLTPSMRRVTLTGADLARFASPHDIHVRLYFPKVDANPAWPTITANGQIADNDPTQAPDMRKYTIRRIDLATAEVDIDFVLHADAGPGSGWAQRAMPGLRLGMAGPGGRTAKTASWMLLAGDETALPAMARVLEGLPPATQGAVLIETAHRSGRIELESPAGMVVHWLPRDGQAQGLAAAVLSIDVPASGSRFCWAGAEFQAIQTIRGHWRHTCGLSKDEQLAVAYWRAGTSDY